MAGRQQFRRLTMDEDRDISRYIIQYAHNIPITELNRLPTWLADLETKRQALEALLAFYQSLPYLAKLFIPSDMRNILNRFMEAKNEHSNGEI